MSKPLSKMTRAELGSALKAALDNPNVAALVGRMLRASLNATPAAETVK